jgi:hypothetical protein
VDIWKPDVREDDVLLERPLISMEIPNGDPGQADLPEEELEKMRARYRYMGIRLRHDLGDEVVPISRETMDLP